MTTSGDIAVGQLIDEYDAWCSSDDGIKIHLLELPRSQCKNPPRHDFEITNLRSSICAAMGFDKANHNIGPAL